MGNTAMKAVIDTCPLEQLPLLTGKKLEFESLAEMVATRACEISEKPFILFYDQVITYKQVNKRANRVAHFLKGKGIKKAI
jgi:long-chain acyl-CoA synthetase